MYRKIKKKNIKKINDLAINSSYVTKQKNIRRMNNLNNKPITNLFINNKFIKLRTNNAIFINLPNYGNHIGWWLNKVFVYSSKKFDDYTAIGIIKNNTLYYMKIWFKS